MGSTPATTDGLAVLVGFAAEARIARPLGFRIAIGGGHAAGATLAARRLVAGGATALISFGLAGGLDPCLPAGTLIVPDAVLRPGHAIPTDPALNRRFGGSTGHRLLGADTIAATAADKHRLWKATGAAAVDLESGAIAEVAAEHALPFAVLRAICDPAGRDLPDAALAALDQSGMIGIGRILGSLLRHPGQLAGLLALARDAAAARRALAERVREIAA